MKRTIFVAAVLLAGLSSSLLAQETESGTVMVITENTEACNDLLVRKERCTSFQVNANLQQIADHFSSVNPNMSPEYLKMLNGWENASPDTIIVSGVFIRYT